METGQEHLLSLRSVALFPFTLHFLPDVVSPLVLPRSHAVLPLLPLSLSMSMPAHSVSVQIALHVEPECLHSL